MAIRFDDRIETNVSGDVLITGDQIAISSRASEVTIGTDTSFDLYIDSTKYSCPRFSTSVKTLDNISDVIDKVYTEIFEVASNVIFPAITNNTKGVTINTSNNFFSTIDTLDVATKVDAVLAKISTDENDKPIKLPLITLLSTPIILSTGYNPAEDYCMFYTTNNMSYPYGTSLESIPKNTLVCITSTNPLSQTSTNVNGKEYHIAALSERIQILSMPVSADDIHNNFETRIANIESLLALK